MTSIAVLVLLDTDDPHLDPEQIDVGTVRSAASVRAAVVASLPKLTRVVAVMPEEQARLMMAALEAVSKTSRPPKSYVAPSRE